MFFTKHGASNYRRYLRANCSFCFFLILLFLSFSGCASRQGVPLESGAKSQFEIYAKVIVRKPQQATKRFFVLWHRQIKVDGVFDEVELKAFGTTYAKLSSGQDGAVLAYKDEIIKAKNVDELGEHYFGESIPFNAFGYWLDGVSSPLAATKEEKRSDSVIKKINQLGWEINYLEYDSAHHPRKIKISTASGLTLDIDVQQWWTP